MSRITQLGGRAANACRALAWRALACWGSAPALAQPPATDHGQLTTDKPAATDHGRLTTDKPAATDHGQLTTDNPATTDAPAPPPTSEWPLEQVELTNGKTYSGLIELEGDAQIEFVEVRRLPGKPMNLIVRQIDRRSIASWKRVSAADRKSLIERIDRFKNHAQIEARRMEDLRLSPVRRDGRLAWQYQGQWFSLDSTAEEQVTRRSIVRLEQIFTAYRQILPPRVQTEDRLQIKLFGAAGQYQDFLGGQKLDIVNPAFYAADFNLIAAGSDINQFVAQLDRARRENEQARKEVESQKADLQKRLQELERELQRNKVPAKDRQTILNAEQVKWNKQWEKQLARIGKFDRRNAAKFNQVSGQMYARLYHEAFHAYLENYVFPHQAYKIPRWLHEGLAQTFESGFLEADTLRVDAPNPQALKRLQSDLASAAPLPLADLLNEDDNTFLRSHHGEPGGRSQLYLYSWGLAYYLAFVQPVLGTERFDAFIAAGATAESPIERFEKLVGMPLERFEKEWRASMLQLKAGTRRGGAQRTGIGKQTAKEIVVGRRG